jgi:hypothetical protein
MVAKTSGTFIQQQLESVLLRLQALRLNKLVASHASKILLVTAAIGTSSTKLAGQISKATPATWKEHHLE